MDVFARFKDVCMMLLHDVAAAQLYMTDRGSAGGIDTNNCVRGRPCCAAGTLYLKDVLSLS